jgi:hypothetical protein
MGIPFYFRTMLADLAGTAVLFGLGPVIENAVKRLTSPHPGESMNEMEVSHSSRIG